MNTEPDLSSLITFIASAVREGLLTEFEYPS